MQSSNLDQQTTVLELPQAPATESGAVKAWQEPVVLRTYLPEEPNRNPMFFERRVYQGSSGRIYPLPFIDRIAPEPTNRTWQAIHIENEFLRIMILPEIGGRIHVGYDKTNGYDFFYRQNVIKPALVGLAGPWISGGVEFNWPQHHRPSTFMPVEAEIAREPDGSITVWCSDHDPMTRMKGMHGVCLHPGNAYLELKVRLYNRTPHVQTFLWWANAAVQVHEKYQSFFPTDVRFVADHAKRAITSFPLSDRSYYGVNYLERASAGVPADETPSEFVPDGSYPANDLRWYANIPVPTSYMITESEQDFFGGYDHRAQGGFVHVANHHIAPGKKQWTWGNDEFGYAWDRSLTDCDGPYIELMAGAYTDNQPDFSFLAPWETRSFQQFWYPIREIGPAQAANLDAAISVRREARRVHIGICVTRLMQNARITLKSHGNPIGEWVADLRVCKAFHCESALPETEHSADLFVSIEAEGAEILRYDLAELHAANAPAVATEPPLPEEIESNEELFLTGLHLEQYRHVTRRPETYWREALRRDRGDARSNSALGRWHLGRAEFVEAENHFRSAISRLTHRNPNPYDGEPYYYLGLALRHQGKEKDAYAAFYKATWNASWRAPAYHALAEIDARRGQWKSALDHVQCCLSADANNLNARNLQAMILRQMGRNSDVDAVLRDVLTLDPLDIWSQYLSSGKIPPHNQQILDLAFDLMRAGFFMDAKALLCSAHLSATDGSVPIVYYVIAFLTAQFGDERASAGAYQQAAAAAPDFCFPNRLEEYVILEKAVITRVEDARAPYYLGNLLYDRRRHEEAVAQWERSVRIDPQFATAWRNLGIAYFNQRRDSARAKEAFDHAFEADPTDACVLYERDQLWKRIGEPPERRLLELQRFPHLSNLRDDISVELAALFNQTHHPEKALELLLAHRFQPWEGGEGLVLAQYTRSNLLLGQRALELNDPCQARNFFEAILKPPRNLGEARHLLSSQSEVWFWIGVSYVEQNSRAEAEKCWGRATLQRVDFEHMSVRPVSDVTFWSAMACQCLGRKENARDLFNSILDHSRKLESQAPESDYFATSLPTMLLFEDDLESRNKIEAKYLRSQAEFGLRNFHEAEEHLQSVLQLDKNHAGAADLLEQIDRLRIITDLE